MSAPVAPEATFRALPARRGVEVVSPAGVPWAVCKRPAEAHVIAALLSECPTERLTRLLADGDKL